MLCSVHDVAPDSKLMEISGSHLLYFFFLNLYMLFLHFYASNSNNYPASCSLLTHMDERISMY